MSIADHSPPNLGEGVVQELHDTECGPETAPASARTKKSGSVSETDPRNETHSDGELRELVSETALRQPIGTSCGTKGAPE